MVSLGCIFLSALICLGQITANMILIAAFFAGLLAICIWACMKDIILPILLYFLPWSPLMKFYKGGISFFTVMLLVVCLAALIKNKMSLNMYQIVLTAMIAILTAIAKMVQENDIANSYIFFLAMLFLLPCVTKRIDSDSFNETTIFFALGIITAALSAQQLVVYHNIAQYITVDSYLTITRLSGYYGDPNFYSAHITACLAGILMLLSREKDRVRQAVLIIVAVLLVYCGMLSASKMFVIVLACLFFFCIPVNLNTCCFQSRRNRFSLIALNLLAIIGKADQTALLRYSQNRMFCNTCSHILSPFCQWGRCFLAFLSQKFEA